MEPKNPFILRGALCTMLALPAALAFAATPPHVEEAVILTGWLHADDLTMTDVVVHVEMDGSTWSANVTEGGKFSITLPANAKATLRIEKPGHLPKEVTVNTHNVHEGEAGKQRVRRISFAVILDPVRRMAGLVYPGPVGGITFDQGGGCLAVAHDRKRVPARRQALMEF